MIELAELREVHAALTTAPPDRAFVTQGEVVEVKRVRRSCYFTLADGDTQLPCALLRRNAAQANFWVTAGQIVEVTGYAERYKDHWQLYVVAAWLVEGDPGWPKRYRYRPARRIVMAFEGFLDLLLGPIDEEQFGPG